jgi:hypothetical protein
MFEPMSLDSSVNTAASWVNTTRDKVPSQLIGHNATHLPVPRYLGTQLGPKFARQFQPSTFEVALRHHLNSTSLSPQTHPFLHLYLNTRPRSQSTNFKCISISSQNFDSHGN